MCLAVEVTTGTAADSGFEISGSATRRECHSAATVLYHRSHVTTPTPNEPTPMCLPLPYHTLCNLLACTPNFRDGRRRHPLGAATKEALWCPIRRAAAAQRYSVILSFCLPCRILYLQQGARTRGHYWILYHRGTTARSQNKRDNDSEFLWDFHPGVGTKESTA